MDTITNKTNKSDFQFLSAPELVVNPSGAAPLAAALTFETPMPVSAEITITGGDRSWTVPTPGGPAARHSYALLGMRVNQGLYPLSRIQNYMCFFNGLQVKLQIFEV